VLSPIDFSDISTEYIGILYEGLLDFQLRRAEAPILFLNIGDLSRDGGQSVPCFVGG
jgi:hypothetical protein